MTVYAMSSIQQECVGADHGGCGKRHDRPTGRDGKPVKVWALSCPGGCEEHLRSKPGWATTISKVPETYDEKAAREDFAERGVLDERRLMAMALAKLTGLDLPETLSGIGGGGFGLIAGELECAEGHPCRPGSKFCPECGASVRQDSAPGVAQCPAGHENDPGARFCAECGVAMSTSTALPIAAEAGGLASLTANQLRSLAKERGLDATGTKADVLSRLQAA